jgi:chorismate mutase
MLRRLIRRLLGIPTVRAIRGATTVAADRPELVAEAVVELVNSLADQNSLESQEIVSAIFTVTGDLSSAFPAVAARSAGWENVPLLCTTEIPVPGGMPRCIRVMLHVERCWEGRSAVRHVYLRDARRLRPDLVSALPQVSGGSRLEREVAA